MSREITDLAFEPDGTIHVTFLETRDIRCAGAVAIRQTIRIAPTDQYADGIQAVADAARALIKDALADWSVSDPADVEIGMPVPLERPLDDESQLLDELPDSELTEEQAQARNWRAIEEARGGPA